MMFANVLFLLIIKSIDFKKLNNTLTTEIMKRVSKTRHEYYKESVVVRNSIFSIFITNIILLFICFIGEFFMLNYMIALSVLISYTITGIIYTIIIWNYCLYKHY